MRNKEDVYADVYRAGRQAKNVWRYIPIDKQEGVTNAFSDSDGYWVWLDGDHVSYDGGEDCGMIHEYTVADLIAAARTIRRGRR